jgi:hypothetical protein
VGLALLGMAGGLVGCSAEPSGPDPASPAPAVLARPLAPGEPVAAPPSGTPVRPGTALATLGTLVVKGRAAKTGYSRAAFGQAWADVDRNGCDTRNDMLNRDLFAKAHKAGTHGCVVLTGTLADPYTGTSIIFRRGAETSSAVQIDHVVALSNAWQTGAAGMDAETRRRLANDPLDLLAVNGASNQTKGDGDAATWLPPAKMYRCSYVARQVAVKARYGLWVTPAERAAMSRVLAACPDQPLTPAAAAISAGRTPEAVPAPSGPSPASEMTTAQVGYPNCAAARAAGVAPLHRGEPGYAEGLDRDHDGVACE